MPASKQNKSKMNERAFSKYFKAFGDPSRLRILSLLSAKPLTVNEIAAQIGLSQPTVSRHLAILRDAEVVENRREGQRVYYSLNRRAVGTCCAGFCGCLQIQLPTIEKKKQK